MKTAIDSTLRGITIKVIATPNEDPDVQFINKDGMQLRFEK